MDILCLTFSLNYHEFFYNPFNGMVKWGMNSSGTGGEVECRSTAFSKLCCIGGYSENNVRAFISGYNIERQLNYPHAALDLSPCARTSKGAVNLKWRNSQIINCMADTKYQLQFNSFNSFIYSINVWSCNRSSLW